MKEQKRITPEKLTALKVQDQLLYVMPTEGEDDFWVSTEFLATHLNASALTIHARLRRYRDNGIVEQKREPSPKRPGQTRFVIDHEGAKWRIRQPQAEQEQQDVAAEGLTTEAHMVLDATFSTSLSEIVSWKTGLTTIEVALAFKEIRQTLGQEV